MKLCESFGLRVNYTTCVEPGVFVAGVECEIEGVRNADSFEIFTITKDGSLRGHGYEFISVPCRKDDLIQGFKKLHDWLSFYPDEDPFSVRTSTHVHVNCMSLEFHEVKNIVLLYALFEEFFFKFVKPVRRNNIHCVPLSETFLAKYYNKDLPNLMEFWHKYTALNIKRLADLGTIEFRHLHGTGDVREFAQWLDILNNLWNLGQRITIDAASLNDEATLLSWFDSIFAPCPDILMMRPSAIDVIKNGLIDVKFSTVA